MKTKLIPGLALVLSGGLIGCFSIAHAGESSPDTRKVVAGNTGFAIDLYGKLRTREGTVFFSPYSISTALAMTCGGARGERVHLDTVLKIGGYNGSSTGRNINHASRVIS
ncbi:MAG TPA: serpin family protein [Verrucomicrobiae bacterium]